VIKSYVELIESTIFYIQTLISERRGESPPPEGVVCVKAALQEIDTASSSSPHLDNPKAMTANTHLPRISSASSDLQSSSRLQAVNPSLCNSNEKQRDRNDLEERAVHTDTASKPLVTASPFEKVSENKKNAKAISLSKHLPQNPSASSAPHASFCLRTVNPPLGSSPGEGRQEDRNDAEREGIHTDALFQQTVSAPLLGKAAENEGGKGFTPHPLNASLAVSHSRMGSALRAVDPTLVLYARPPSDKKAKQMKNAWNKHTLISEVPILFDKPHYDPFLSHVAKAITCRFAPSQPVEISSFETGQQWDLFLRAPHLRLVLCPKQLMFKSKELLKFYRENVRQKKCFLRDVPLLLLSNSSSYKTDPRLKSFLWNLICQMLS